MSPTAVATATAAVESAATATAVESTTTATSVEPTTTATAEARAAVEPTTTANAEARAAMESAAGITAVESAGSAYTAAMESTGAPTRESAATPGITGWTVIKAVSSSCVSNAAVIAVVVAGVAVVSGVAVISRAAIISTATVVTAATVVPTVAPITVVPGTGADEEATDEPARSVVTIRSAGVRIIRVIAPGADRSRVVVTVVSVSSITDAYTHTNLGVSRSRHQRCGNQRAEQQKISEKLHFGTSAPRHHAYITNRFGDTANTLGYLRVPTTYNNVPGRKLRLSGGLASGLPSAAVPLAHSPSRYILDAPLHEREARLGGWYSRGK